MSHFVPLTKYLWFFAKVNLFWFYVIQNIISCTFSSNSIYITWDYLVAKKIGNYQTDPKNNQNLAWNQLSAGLPIEKIWKSTRISLQTLSSNGKDLVTNIRNLYRDVPISNICTENLCKTFPNFYHSVHAWNHNTMTSFIIFKIHLLLIKI